jgi:hypothetical protein
VLVSVERGQDDDLGRARTTPYRLGRGQAVGAGHADVHQYDVRSQPVDQPLHATTVARLADDADVRRAAEH